MKKFIFGAMALFLSASVAFAQAPRQFSYQTVVRNSSNALVANSNVGIRISILKTSATGVSQYSERHSVTTNANGLASLTIGTGTQTTGSLANIEWINDNYFVKTEVDPAGGTNYNITGTSQILAAPYALNGFMPGPYNDPTFKGGGGGWTRIGGKTGLTFWANDSIQLNDRPLLSLFNDNRMELRGAGAEIFVGTRALGDGALWLGNANHGIKRTLNDVTIQTLGGGNTGMIIFANGGAATPTERMRIFHNGNVGIGTANPTALLSVNGSANNTTGSWGTFSDARLKTIDGKFSEGLSTIMKINPVTFHYNDKAPLQSNDQQIGIIAQDLEKVAPYMVSKTEAGDIKDLRQVNNQAYTFLLINAVKEQQAQIEALRAENAALKADNKEVKTSLNTFQTQMEAIQAKLEALVPAETAKK